MMTDSDHSQRRAALEQRFDGWIPRHRLPEVNRPRQAGSAHRLTRRIAERRQILGRSQAVCDPVLARLSAHLREMVLAERHLR